MPSTDFNMLSYSKTHKGTMQSKSRSGRTCDNSRSDSILPPSKRHKFDGYSNQSKSKLSITTGKCSSINPYRIFILLVIGFPGLNNGKPFMHWLYTLFTYNRTDWFIIYIYISVYFILIIYSSIYFVLLYVSFRINLLFAKFYMYTYVPPPMLVHVLLLHHHHTFIYYFLYFFIHFILLHSDRLSLLFGGWFRTCEIGFWYGYLFILRILKSFQPLFKNVLTVCWAHMHTYTMHIRV